MYHLHRCIVLLSAHLSLGHSWLLATHCCCCFMSEVCGLWLATRLPTVSDFVSRWWANIVLNCTHEIQTWLPIINCSTLVMTLTDVRWVILANLLTESICSQTHIFHVIIYSILHCCVLFLNLWKIYYNARPKFLSSKIFVLYQSLKWKGSKTHGCTHR